jgi:hypothetical protein
MKPLSVEYYIGMQDGISFAYNIGTEEADTAAAIDSHSPDYSKGFIEGFEKSLIKTRRLYNEVTIIQQRN